MMTKKPVGKSWAPPRGISLRRRDNRGGIWVVQWRDSSKCQRQRSFKARDLAEAFARDLVAKRKESGATGITGINSAAWRDFQTLNSVLNGATISQLMAVWEKHKHEVLGGDTSLPLGEAVARHLAAKTKERMSAVAHRHLRFRSMA